MTCEICGELIVEEHWDNDEVQVLNPERAQSPVVDTKVAHKECITDKNFISEAGEIIQLEKELIQARINYLKNVISYKEVLTEKEFKNLANTRSMLISLDQDYHDNKEFAEQLNKKFESYDR